MFELLLFRYTFKSSVCAEWWGVEWVRGGRKETREERKDWGEAGGQDMFCGVRHKGRQPSSSI